VTEKRLQGLDGAVFVKGDFLRGDGGPLDQAIILFIYLFGDKAIVPAA